jgi:hypothetical protein
MLRVLVLTYQDPTEKELRLLAGLDAPTPEQESELHDLILKCRPLIVLKGGDNSSESTVCFAEAVVKTHLLENAHKLLGLTSEDIKLQHGILGFRAFSHVLEMFDFPLDPIPETQGDDVGGNADPVEENVAEGEEDNNEQEINSNQLADDNDDDDAASSPSGDPSNNGEAEEEEEDDDGEDQVEEQEEDEDPEAAYLKNIAEAYAVKHWLSHASQATEDIAEALSLEEKFWEGGSVLRRRWLTEHNRLTDSFKYYGRSDLTGLHIAAAIGFRELVSALMDNGYDGDKLLYDSDWSIPVSDPHNYRT